MNNLFVQFINPGPLLYGDKKTPFYVFQNGLSSSWNRFKQVGELIWIEPDESIPSFVGNVYISCWFYNDMKKSFIFAKNNPQTNVFVGGIIRDITI